MERFLRSVCLVVVLALLAPVPGRALGPDAGDTYAALEAEAIRVKTVFAGAYAVAEIFNEDEIHARLYSERDGLLGEIILSKNEKSLRANFQKIAAGTVGFADAPGLKLTKDWANLQVYSLWRDLQSMVSRETALETLTWQGHVFRPAEIAAKAGLMETERHWGRARGMVRSITTEFAFVTAVTKPDPLLKAGTAESDVAYSTFSTELKSSNGERLGLMRWFDRESVLVWDFPGLTSGFANNDRIPGGFPFKPDMGWSNIQSYAFWKSHSELTLPKNEPGCDFLHYFDNTILRPCCDRHDLCYEQNGCTAGSWWVFGSSWSCIRCNIAVVFCFATGGGGGSGSGGGGGGGGDACNNRPPGGWCPAECFSCGGGGGGPMSV